jgi:hypothetical protein
MGERRAGREGPFEDRQMWRRLFARLHPDTGGDHELFLFACALKDELCAGPCLGEASTHRAEPDSSLRTWRSGLNSWASRNRDALRRGRPRRDGARDRRPREAS